jgi:uncharacterized protein
MRLDKGRLSDNVEDRRTPDDSSRGPGFPRSGAGGGGPNMPLGSRSGLSWRTMIVLAIAYITLKLIFGIDLIRMLNDGGGVPPPGGTETSITLPGGTTDVSDVGNVGGGTAGNDVGGDTGKDFVKRVLGSTERVWTGIFKGMGKQYEDPKLVLFTGFVESECGNAEAAIGPFYCAADHTIYIDLSFYQDLKIKQGASGDFAEAYVIAHEVGHHVQNLLGIAEEVTAQRMRVSDEESNMLSVRMELQADCLAGVWAREADKTAHILEAGDVDAALNAAAQIGDDRLQKRPQGYLVPESFTHGTSEQRVRWLKTGLAAEKLDACDTFGTNQL